MPSWLFCSNFGQGPFPKIAGKSHVFLALIMIIFLSLILKRYFGCSLRQHMFYMWNKINHSSILYYINSLKLRPLHPLSPIFCQCLFDLDKLILHQSRMVNYSKTCLKRPLKKKTKIGFQDWLLLNAGQKYCRMLLGEHSAILLTYTKLAFVIKDLCFVYFWVAA